MAAALLAKSATKAIVPACRAEARQGVKPRLVPAKKAVSTKQLVANTPAAEAFYVWNPINNKMFETFSYLPPLTNDQIAMQVEYIVDNGWIPALEFTDGSNAYVKDDSTVRFLGTSVGYQDNRYWTMWKLPLFGCTDPDVVLKEVGLAVKAFPDAYVRLVAFDNIRQVQVISFLVHRPTSVKDWQPVDKRSVNPEGGSSSGGGSAGGRRRSRSSSYSW